MVFQSCSSKVNFGAGRFAGQTPFPSPNSSANSTEGDTEVAGKIKHKQI